MTPENWTEYENACDDMARRGLKGEPGDPLPELMSAAVVAEITEHNDEFQTRVRACAYAQAMERIEARALKCDMGKDCREQVTHIDAKGYIYCRKHGVSRKASGVRCRQLKPAEIKTLGAGEPLPRYADA